MTLVLEAWVNVAFDERKRQATLQERGLDFADAARVLTGPTVTLEDDRYDYPERRFQTYGLLDDRLVMFAWTPDTEGIRVISMRRCNDREQRKFAAQFGRR